MITEQDRYTQDCLLVLMLLKETENCIRFLYEVSKGGKNEYWVRKDGLAPVTPSGRRISS